MNLDSSLIDGKFNIRVDRGKITGKLHRDSQIEVQTDQESIFLNGGTQTEFSLRYTPRGGLQITDPVLNSEADGAVRGIAGDSASKKAE